MSNFSFLFSISELELVHVDEFVDELLHDDRVCDVILPRIQVNFRFIWEGRGGFALSPLLFLPPLSPSPPPSLSLQRRYILEQIEQLEPRVSALDEDLSEEEEEEEDEEEERVREGAEGRGRRGEG